MHFLWESFSKLNVVKVKEAHDNLAACLFAFQGPELTCGSKVFILGLEMVTELFALFYLCIHASYNNVQNSHT